MRSFFDEPGIASHNVRSLFARIMHRKLQGLVSRMSRQISAFPRANHTVVLGFDS